MSENVSFVDNYKINLKEEPAKYYGILLFSIGLVFGIISLGFVFLSMDQRLTIAAIFFDIALLGLVLIIGTFLQSDRMQVVYWRVLGPVIEAYREGNYRKFGINIAGLGLIFYILLLVLNTITPINFIQQTIFAIVVAANLIMVSVGLTLTTRVRKFSNFAQSEFLIVGIYVSIALSIASEANWYKSGIIDFIFTTAQLFYIEIILAFIITGLIGIASEYFIFGPLTKRNATPLSLMVSSIGLGLILRQSVQEIYGSVPRTSPPSYPHFFDSVGDSIQSLGGIPGIGWIFNLLSTPFAESTKFTVFWQSETLFRISRDETWSIIIFIFTIAALQYVFTRTTLGISMRATADDDDLAQITGINTKRVIFWTWFIAAGVTGIGAIYFFEAAQIQPGSGFVQLLLIFAVVILGGFDSFEGTVVSGFIISFSMTAAVILNSRLGGLQKDVVLVDKMVFWSTSGDWKFAVAFAIIIVVLIFRPRGIFGLIDPRSKL
ncbi:MAG: branched-chain amino acid ABC transporter permease [Candidatus Kariarchaeaceae archaeon]|jgi:branched-subunit amino acid ABC-type transport system permease component